MKILRFYSFLLLITFFFTACIENVTTDLAFEPKYLVMGFVPNYVNGSAIVKVTRSVPVTDSRNSILVKDLNIQLMALSENSDTSFFDFIYDSNMEQYHTLETQIAKPNYTYWIVFELDGIAYQSQPIKLALPLSELDIVGEDNNPYYYTIKIEEQFQKNSYFIGAQFNDAWNVFQAIQSGQFCDKNQVLGNVIEKGIFWDMLSPNNWIYIIELPNVMEDFFKAWNNQQNTQSDDPLSQIFAITPANLDGNIQRMDGQVQDAIIGVFFPCNSIKIKP